MNGLVGESLLRLVLLSVIFSFVGAVFVRFGTRVICQFTVPYWTAYGQFLLGYVMLGIIWMFAALLVGPEASPVVDRLAYLSMLPLAILVYGGVHARGITYPDGEEIGLRKGLLVAVASTLCSMVVAGVVVMIVYLIVT